MSASLCGGLAAGPIAAGSGSGTSLALTLTRDILCDGVLHVVAGAVHPHDPALFPDSPDVFGAVDSAGGVYGLFSGLATIGSVRQDAGTSHDWTTLMLGSSVLRPVAAGELVTGDTITVTFNSDDGGIDTIAMAFLLTGGGLNAVAIPAPPFAPAVEYGESYAYPDEGSPSGACTDKILTYERAWQGSPPLRVPIAECALIAGSLTYNGGGDYTPAEGTLLGQYQAGTLGLAVSLIADIASGSAHEPGGAWSASYGLAVGNWQFVELVEAVGPTLRGRFRAV